MDILRHRAQLRDAMRHSFRNRDYLEVDTPCLVDVPGCEVHLQYFETKWLDYGGESSTGRPKWLRSSPELHMKQLLDAQTPRIFQLGPSFRNLGELSDWHHPEFWLLEWYKVGISWREYIAEATDLLREWHHAMGAKCALPTNPVYLSLAEAFGQFAKLELVDLDPELGAKAQRAGIHSCQPSDSFETAFFKVILERIEPEFKKLQWVVLYDYPASQAALARVEDGWAKRFEMYLHGIELSNGFLEVMDEPTCAARFAEVDARRREAGHAPSGTDKHLLTHLKNADLPSTCGNALGFDRLLALYSGAHSLDASVNFRAQFIARPEGT
jgi:elongation factor P--(R)-beta-lysine ligase